MEDGGEAEASPPSFLPLDDISNDPDPAHDLVDISRIAKHANLHGSMAGNPDQVPAVLEVFEKTLLESHLTKMVNTTIQLRFPHWRHFFVQPQSLTRRMISEVREALQMRHQPIVHRNCMWQALAAVVNVNPCDPARTQEHFRRQGSRQMRVPRFSIVHRDRHRRRSDFGVMHHTPDLLGTLIRLFVSKKQIPFERIGIEMWMSTVFHLAGRQFVRPTFRIHFTLHLLEKLRRIRHEHAGLRRHQKHLLFDSDASHIPQIVHNIWNRHGQPPTCNPVHLHANLFMYWCLLPKRINTKTYRMIGRFRIQKNLEPCAMHRSIAKIVRDYFSYDNNVGKYFFIICTKPLFFC